MSWVAVGTAAASVVGSAVQSKSAKSASKKAKKGSDKQIAYAKESRDMARLDTRHTRQAGATALNALMSMTGLPFAGDGEAVAPPSDAPPDDGFMPDAPPVAAQRPVEGMPSRYQSAYNIHARAGGGHMYNINEMGPENVYAGGHITRNPNPMTIDGQTGYVEPNIQGRAVGGPMEYMQDPQRPVAMAPPTVAQNAPQSPQNQISQALVGRDLKPQNRGQKSGSSNSLAKFGASFDPLLGGVFGAFGGSGQGSGQGPAYGSGRRGELPGTDWVRGEGGKIKKTGIGHWNEEMGQYVDRRGRPRQNQAAPPEGYVDPSTQPDIDTTLGRDYNWQTDPGYQFRFDEGMRGLENSAAARGGLLSGGFGRKAIRYGQGFASNEYSNVYNRISNIAGMGQVANQGAGQAALYGGAAMGQGAAAGGINSAYGDIGSGNAIQGGLNQLGQIDWGSMFNRGGGQATQPYSQSPPDGRTI